jgi:hypothetical protein
MEERSACFSAPTGWRDSTVAAAVSPSAKPRKFMEPIVVPLRPGLNCFSLKSARWRLHRLKTITLSVISSGDGALRRRTALQRWGAARVVGPITPIARARKTAKVTLARSMGAILSIVAWIRPQKPARFQRTAHEKRLSGRSEALNHTEVGLPAVLVCSPNTKVQCSAPWVRDDPVSDPAQFALCTQVCTVSVSGERGATCWGGCAGGAKGLNT